MYKVSTPEEVVFYTNSDSKSIVLVTKDGRMTYAGEGLYGGFILKLKEDEVGDVEEFIRNARAFFVEPKVKQVEYKELPEELKKVVDEWLDKLPDDVQKELTVSEDDKAIPFNVDIVEYTYVEVKPVIKKKKEGYVVLDFEPKPGGLKLNARAVRIYVTYSGSNKYPRGKMAGRKEKEFKLKYPDNEVVQKYMYSSQLSFKSSALYLKIPVEAPRELLPSPTAVSERELEDVELDLDELKKEWGLVGSGEEKGEEGTEEDVEVEIELSPSEVRRIAENYLRRKGLIPLRIVVFKLPTEYLRSKTKLLKEKDKSKYIEQKELRLNPSEFRSLRRGFYEELHRIAWKSEVGWVLYRDADLAPINKYIEKLNKLLKENNIPLERYIEVIEVYMPKDFIVREITRYIKERKMAYEEIARKIKEEADKAKAVKQAKKTLEKIEEELKRLEQELKYIQTK